MGPNLGFPLPLPRRTTLNRGLILNPCPSCGAKFGPWPPLNFVQGARFGSMPSPPPSSLSLGFTVQQRPHGPHTYIKATARLRARWPLTPCLPRFPSEEHLTRSRPPSRVALQGWLACSLAALQSPGYGHCAQGEDCAQICPSIAPGICGSLMRKAEDRQGNENYTGMLLPPAR
jgi:hypothetical protein